MSPLSIEWYARRLNEEEAKVADLLAALEEAADKLGVAQLQGVQGIGPMLTRHRRLIAATHQGEGT